MHALVLKVRPPGSVCPIAIVTTQNRTCYRIRNIVTVLGWVVCPVCTSPVSTEATLLFLFLIVLVVVVLIAILITAGGRNQDEKIRQVAAANHERIRRQKPDSEYAQMGEHEFADEYGRFLKRRGRSILLVFIILSLASTAFVAVTATTPNVSNITILIFGLGIGLIITGVYRAVTGGRYPKWPKK